MKRTLIAAVVILGLASATMARPGFGKGMRDGQGMGRRDCMMQGRGGPGAGGGLMAMAEELQLTEQQTDQIQKLQTEFCLQMVDQQAAVEKAHIALRALMRDDAPESKVTAAIDDLSAKEAQLQKQRYRHQQQIRSILTEEQQQKAKELRMNRNCDGDGPRGGRKGMRGGDGPRGGQSGMRGGRFFDDDSDEDDG